jgi:hypothetical protein
MQQTKHGDFLLPGNIVYKKGTGKYLCSGFLIEKGVWRSNQFARPLREQGIK